MTPFATIELHRVHQTRNDAEDAAKAARTARRNAVIAARREGLTLAEIADALGVSYQRVHQIAKEADEQ